jgi:hypothetical protein
MIEPIFCANDAVHPYGRRILPGAVCVLLTNGSIACMACLEHYERAGEVLYVGPRGKSPPLAPSPLLPERVQRTPVELLNAIAMVNRYLAGDDMDAYLKAQPGRCAECGYHVCAQGHGPGCRHRPPAGGLRFVFEPPWSERPSVIIRETRTPYVADYDGAGLRADQCDVCGEPRGGLGLTEKCKDAHAWCRGCSVHFSQPGGLLLLNPGRRCRRGRHPKPGRDDNRGPAVSGGDNDVRKAS